MEPTSKRFELFGLFFGCPEMKPLKNCPLQVYRKGSAIEKLEILENMAEDELHSILSFHGKCLSKRVQQKIKLYSS